MSNLLFPPLGKALKERKGPGMAVVQDERRKQWLQEQEQHMMNRVMALAESGNTDYDTSSDMTGHPPADSASKTARKFKKSNKKGSHGHKRGYVACDECRKQKVKCEPASGDVDNPGDEGCVKCQRERKNCSLKHAKDPKRSKRSKLSHELMDTASHNGSLNGRIIRAPTCKATLAPADSIVADNSSTPAGTDHPLTETEEQIYGSSVPRGMNAMHEAERMDARLRSQPIAPVMPDKPDKPLLPALDAAEEVIYRSPAYKDSSKADQESASVAWGRFFLCRRRTSGSFSPLEGMGYVQKFFANLAPLTPVTGLLKNYGPLSMHEELLEEHPVLALAILAISSRYFEPSTAEAMAAPAISRRAIDIHSALYAMLQKMIHEVNWTQGDLGHDIQSAGGQDDSTKSSWARKLRSFSTIEGLLLLTEWHSRGLLQPDFESTCDIMFPSKSDLESMHGAGSGDAAVGEWLQPCLRSNRASWNLLTQACQLAVEIGAWDQNMDISNASEEEQRQIKTLSTLLYISMQAAGVKFCMRPCPGPLPGIEFLQDNSTTGPCEIDNPTLDDKLTHTLWHWKRLMSTVREADSKLYGKVARTLNYITSGEYRKLAISYDNRLADFANELGTCQILVTRNQRRIMNLEIQYWRIQVLSISIRAIWYRVRQRTSGQPIAPPEVLHQEISQDQSSIQRMLDAGVSFLETVLTFDQDWSLRYLPTHSYFRIVAVSFSLIKCFYMGVDTACARMVLDMITLASKAFMYNSALVDDDHIGPKVGRVLSKLAKQVELKLWEAPVNKQSKKHSRTESSSSADNGHDAQKTNKTSVRRATALSNRSRGNTKQQASTNHEHPEPALGGHQTVQQPISDFYAMDVASYPHNGAYDSFSRAPTSLHATARAAADNIPPIPAAAGLYGTLPLFPRDPILYQHPSGNEHWTYMPWTNSQTQPEQMTYHNQNPMERVFNNVTNDESFQFQHIMDDEYQPYLFNQHIAGGSDANNYGGDQGNYGGDQDNYGTWQGDYGGRQGK